MAYNMKHGITPQQIVKTTLSSITTTMVQPEPKAYVEKTSVDYAADPVVQYLNPAALKKLIEKTRKEMEAAARQLDFLEAARLRDELFALEKIYKEKTSKTTR
jgi:excinuclease ABC subunit B